MLDSRTQKRSMLMSLAHIATILSVGEQLQVGCALVDKIALSNNKSSSTSMRHGLRRRRLDPELSDHIMSSAENTIPQQHDRHALQGSTRTRMIPHNRELEKIRQTNVPPTVSPGNETLNATAIVLNITDFNATNSTGIVDENINGTTADEAEGDKYELVNSGAPGDIQDLNQTNITAIKDGIIDGAPDRVDDDIKDPVNPDAPGDMQDAEDPASGGTNTAALTTSVLIIVAISAVAGLTVGVLTAIYYGHRKRRRRRATSVGSRSNSKRSNGSYQYNDIEDTNAEGEDYDDEGSSDYSSDNSDSSDEGHGAAPQAVVHGTTSKNGSQRLSSSKTGALLKGRLHGLGQSLHDVGSSLHGSVVSIGSMPEAFVKGKRNGKTGVPDSFVEGKRKESAASREVLDDDDDSTHRGESAESVPGPMVAGHRRTSLQNSESHEGTESSKDTGGDGEESPRNHRSHSKKTNGKKLTPNHRQLSDEIEINPSDLNMTHDSGLTKRSDGRSDGLIEDMLSELGSDGMTGDEAFSAQQKARNNWDRTTREDSAGLMRSMGDSEYSQ